MYLYIYKQNWCQFRRPLAIKMARKVIGGKELALAFFTDEGCSGGFWKCTICETQRKKSGTSYANLISHIKHEHKNYEDLLIEKEGQHQLKMSSLLPNKKIGKYLGWFDIVINGLLPFSAVENEAIRRNVRHDSISLSTFMTYLVRLTKVVETKLKDSLPEKLALVFDGWSSGSTHYVGVFASFSSSASKVGYETRLLAFSPFEDESHLDTVKHVSYLTGVLEIFGKSWANVSCLIGDNCNTNKAIANYVELPFVGCASHRLDLAVVDFMNRDDSVLKKIDSIMSKLKTLKLSAKLREYTNLRPRKSYEKRWSGTHAMLLRYKQLQEFLPKLESSEINELLLTPQEDVSVDLLLKELKDIDSVTKILQARCTTLSDVRALFDALIDQYPNMKPFLKADANIVHSKQFESGIVKIQIGKGEFLSSTEKTACSQFKVMVENNENLSTETLSFAERALKRQKSSTESSSDSYLDTRFIIPTSNDCERLFSKVGYVLNDRRQSVLPMNLEAQLFLNVNNDLWSNRDIMRLPE